VSDVCVGQAHGPTLHGAHIPTTADYRAAIILEHALLDVRAGSEEEFEAAFATARGIISASPGFLDLRLVKGIERPHQYLLLVEWETLEDHTVGFRGSLAYQQWRALLHHFYDPFPEVVHFTPLP
jgi:heme-degrading monooxygenase HmoA